MKMLKSICRRSGTKQVIQAESMDFVAVFLEKCLANYIVSLPRNTAHTDLTHASFSIRNDNYCFPFINFDSIIMANNYSQKLLVENILIDYTDIHNVQFHQANVIHEYDLR
jgi:hypothetical protein